MTEQIFQGDGFTVEPVGMHRLRYNEGARSALAYGETTILNVNNLTTGYVLYSDTIRWEGGQELNEQDRSRIMSGLLEALTAWEVSFQVE